MTPTAVLVHHLAGRTRFRVAEKRGDPSYFTRLREQFAQCPGVVSVGTRETTGSVIIFHDAAEPDVLVSYARTFDLFDVAGDRAAVLERPRGPAALMTDGLRDVDRWIRTETREGTDLRSLALTGLIGAALWQLLRGQVLPAAGTLIWYALSVATTREGPSGHRAEETSPKADHQDAGSAVG